MSRQSMGRADWSTGAACVAVIVLGGMEGCIPAGDRVRPSLLNSTDQALWVSFRSNSSREHESLDLTLASGGTMTVPRTLFVPEGKPAPSAEIHVISPSANEKRVLRVEFVGECRFEVVASGGGYEVHPLPEDVGGAAR